jgi:hypothetical protein
MPDSAVQDFPHNLSFLILYEIAPTWIIIDLGRFLRAMG